ncbi:MAG: SDR family oxidoreductase [Armatimonadetes bacterium]|nr:SDR family oxidoreductase [Armatimonadota bacterium]
MNEQTLSGQVALVTGGGQGIGLAMAKALAARGARVAVTGRRMATLGPAAAGLGTSGTAVQMDVRDDDAVRQAVAQVVEWGGRLDILVNNAGIGVLETPILETTPEVFRDVMETNLTGSFVVTQAAWPHLVASRGQILNVSSIAGTMGYAGASAYCSSKWAMNGLTLVLKEEGKVHGIRAFALCPGAIDTDIWTDTWADKDVREKMISPGQLADLAMSMLEAPRNIELPNPWIVTNAVSPWV